MISHTKAELQPIVC